MIIAAAGLAIFGAFIGAAHSGIGEQRILRPLFAERADGVLTDRLAAAAIRSVWHIPSLIWAIIGVAVFLARLKGGDTTLSVMVGIVFAVSAAANLIWLRTVNIGGVLLLTAAGLVVADSYFNI